MKIHPWFITDRCVRLGIATGMIAGAAAGLLDGIDIGALEKAHWRWAFPGAGVISALGAFYGISPV